MDEYYQELEQCALNSERVLFPESYQTEPEETE